MPSGSSERRKFKYYNTFEGQWTEPCEPDHPKVLTRVNKNGKTVHELHHDFIEGYIHKIQKRDGGEYGWELMLTVRPNRAYNEEDELEVCSLSLYGRMGQMFFNQWANIGASEIKVRLRLWGSLGDDKVYRSFLYINTEPIDDNAKWDHTEEHWKKKEDKNYEGLPAFEERMDKGKKVFDSTNMVNAMIGKLMPEIERLNMETPFVFVKEERTQQQATPTQAAQSAAAPVQDNRGEDPGPSEPPHSSSQMFD